MNYNVEHGGLLNVCTRVYVSAFTNEFTASFTL